MDAKTLYKGLHKGHLAQDARRTHSARVIADICLKTLKPHTVIDVGCGVGHLLAQFEASGIKVLGLEGDWLDPSDAVCRPDAIQPCDLERPFSRDERFDLAICLEVAEHLEPSRAGGLIADLCKLSDTVIFSAAIEGQGGTGHKNERWQDYWAALFELEGYRFYDLFRPMLWPDPDVYDWFKQNMMLFVRDNRKVPAQLARHAAPISAARMIVPKYHDKVVQRLRRENRRLRRLAKNAEV